MGVPDEGMAMVDTVHLSDMLVTGSLVDRAIGDILFSEQDVRDGGSSNTRLDLDQAHSYDVGVLLATLTYYSDSKQIVGFEEDKTRRMKEILRGSEESGLESKAQVFL